MKFETPTQTEPETAEDTAQAALETLMRLATAFNVDIADVEETVLERASPPPNARVRIFNLEQDVKRVEAERDALLLTLSKLEMEVALLQGEREQAALEQARLATLEAPLQKAWPFVTAADWLAMQQTIFRLREALSALQPPHNSDSFPNNKKPVTEAQRASVKAQAALFQTKTETCLASPNMDNIYHTLYQVRQENWPYVSEEEWDKLLAYCNACVADLDAYKGRISRLEKHAAELEKEKAEMLECLAAKTRRIRELKRELALEPEEKEFD